MTIDNKIRDKILQYDINREAAKLSALSSRKIDKYKYLTDEEKHIKSIWKTNKNDWRSRRKTKKGTWRAWETTS